ncbi:MAG: hypothetical protein M9921_05710 [Fimbriimonadaceae bacterium]|nr:hypothetical protein [Fimbriimonadaceae bacterium]
MRLEAIWTALPVAVSGNTLKLSVFVSHRLYGPPATTLGAGGFTDVLGWAGKNVKFNVRFGGGPPVPATVVSAINAQLHAAAFPGTTPVRGNAPTDPPQRFQRMAQREMQSYSAAALGILLRGTYQGAATLSPTDRIDADQIVNTTLAWADPLRPRRPYTEAQLLPTQYVNLGSARIKKGDRRSFAAVWAEAEKREADSMRKEMDSALKAYRNSGGAAPPNTPAGWRLLAYECKRFFESMAPTKNHPKYGVVHAAVNVPEPSFDYHDAQSLVANHPSLMRALGFVFDLEVPLPAGLPASGEVRVEPVYTKAPDTVDRTPKTAYQFVPGQLFLPKPKAGSELGVGYLKIGGAPYFTAQYDIDSGALKLMDFVQNMRNALQVRKQVEPTNPPRKQQLLPGTETLDLDNSEIGRSKVTLPALRTTGISLYRNERAQKIKAVFQKAMAMQADLAPATKAFDYDDVVRGYRVDVFDRGAWRPLMGRVGGYNLKGIQVPAAGQNGAPFDEAWMSSAMTSSPSKPGDPPATGPVKVHEAVWSWHGWSLAVERPGQAMDDLGKPTQGSNKLDPNFPVAMNFQVPPGSLPTLRFGHTYKMRARAVDLAGNSLPPNAPTLGGPGFETPEAPYLRFDPVLSPQLVNYKVPGNADPVKDTTAGAAENQIVIRKFKGDPTIRPSRREVFPPYGSVSLSETHGMFDLPNGKMDPAAYPNVIVPREGKSAPPEVTGSMSDVPYLPDPLSFGYCVQFTPLPFPNAPTGVKFALGKFPSAGWPKIGTGTLQIVSNPGPASPAPVVSGGNVTLGLRPGEVVKALVSSSLGNQSALNLMGLWNWLPPATQASHQDAALQGRMWLMTPYREVTLVHAVQIPEAPAQILFFKAYRSPGDTSVRIGDNEQTAMVTHAWSTVEVEAMAQWEDELDLIEEPIRTTLKRKVDMTAFKVGINRDEFLHRFVERHEIGDTKYHNVTYTLRAASRFRDYFPSQITEFTLDTVGDIPKTVLGRNLPAPVKGTLNFDAVSTARPDVPLIEYIVPTFGWSRPSVPTGQRSIRDGGGLRIYLRRPWFSSGNGERLAIVLPSGAYEGAKAPAGMPNAAEYPYVTLFGADPTNKSGNVHARPLSNHFPGAAPAGKYLKLEENPALNVGAVSVPVQFDAERQLWFADVQIDAGNAAYMPFVRLALARYQEFSVPGLELSRVAVADFMQLAPDRSATVTYLSDTRFKVVVSGVGTADGSPPGRVIVGTVEVSPGTYDGKAVTDEETGWRPVVVGGKDLEKTIPLTPALNRVIIGRPPPEEEGVEEQPLEAGQGRVAVPPPNQGRVINPQIRPTVQEGPGEFTLPGQRGAAKYRLVLREYEVYLSDFPEPVIEMPPTTAAPPPTRGRLVYMDVIPLA